MKKRAGHVNEVGILLYPGVQASSVYGLTDLFECAARFAQEQRQDGRSDLRLTHWRPVEPSGGMTCAYDTRPGQLSHLSCLIIPPTLSGFPEPGLMRPIADWVREQHSRGVTLASVCTGLFILAETGVLAGRSIATHPRCANDLSRRFPDIAIDHQQRVLDDGDVITAGGYMAWVNVALLLIDRMLGHLVKAETIQFLRADGQVRDARYFAGFAPVYSHHDAAVSRVQDWIHHRDGRSASLVSLAEVAHLEVRTFHRRFLAATGLTPAKYCREVRIARARELLEFGRRPIKLIAESLGYEDVASFARAFHKVSGMPPAAYRKRFGSDLAGPATFL
jgi:transcriptional regulator GlxA family with amidase domain